MTGAKAAVDKSRDKLKMLPASCFKEKTSQRWFHKQRRTKDLFIAHPSWASASSNTPSMRNISRNYNGRVVLPVRETTSKTTMDTEQFSRSKDIRPRQWQQQKSWIHVLDPLAWLVKPAMMLPLRRTCRKNQDHCDCQRKSARKNGRVYHQVEDRNNGTRLMNQWF